MNFARGYSAIRLLVIVFLGLGACTLSSAENFKYNNRIWESNEVLSEYMRMPEKRIPPFLLKEAKAIAIFPSMVKAGFIVAGQYGNGVISYRGDDGNWSAPAFFRMSGGSVGFQIGGQASDVVLVITSDRGIRGLLANKFTLGADASVSAGPTGRDAEAKTDWKMKSSIYTYSRSKGLFAGVSVDGMVINQDKGANEAIYGDGASAESILFHATHKPNEEGQKLISTLKTYAS